MPIDLRLGDKTLDLAQETDLLSKIPMFAKLDLSKLKLLAFTSETLTFEDNGIVFHAGDTADCAFVIMQGSIDILIDTENGPVVSLTLQQNQLFGELALLNNAPRNATLRAKGQIKVMRITADMFLKLLTENSEMALDVMRQLSNKLAKSHEHVEVLQQELSNHVR
ncbi:MAG: CRP/FNR family cyclic AMP-dependent transcriptional regulator [Candidatus Azotimanducaceae bacterium]|jgi:CRP/FNR family cyclic AMP-dependent transcriptional regulator